MAQLGPRNGCNNMQDCDLQAMSLEQLFMSLFLKSATTGCVFINYTVTEADCEDVEKVACDTGDTWQTLFRKAVVIDDCGYPALNMITLSNGLYS